MRRASCFAATVLVAAFVSAAQLAAAPQAPDAAALARSHSPFDLDGDGHAELLAVEHLDGRGAATNPRLVVLVEARLLAERPGIDDGLRRQLRARLDRFVGDLAATGRRAELLAVDAARGERHQDGRTLLALRRLLIAFAQAPGTLDGAVLVGHFPDALLVRTCNWRRTDRVELTDHDGQRRTFDRWLRTVPENVAWKCDLVLADLDGNWEALWFEQPQALPSVQAAFDGDVPPRGGPAVAIATGAVTFRDAFHLADGAVTADAAARTVTIDDDDRDHETTASDRVRPNALAQPEISVSRIDARGVARTQASDGARGDEPDAVLELRLLVDYFDRNHVYRTTPCTPDADKPAAIAWELGSGMAALRGARDEWRGFAEQGHDVHEGVDLAALTQWFARPAVLRTLRAHSDPYAAVFAGGARADHAFYRGLWQAGTAAPQPFLLLHTGCEAIAPHGATTLAYDHPGYGRHQHAEAILFFTPCVALLGRAKVFYDEPRGFAETLRSGGSIGDAWRHYFAIEAGSSWDIAGGDIGRKRSYFWSVLGDWTLGLPTVAR
jgi:hypothetical protein